MKLKNKKVAAIMMAAMVTSLALSACGKAGTAEANSAVTTTVTDSTYQVTSDAGSDDAPVRS